jgi:hypothetical protein
VCRSWAESRVRETKTKTSLKILATSLAAAYAADEYLIVQYVTDVDKSG